MNTICDRLIWIQSVIDNELCLWLPSVVFLIWCLIPKHFISHRCLTSSIDVCLIRLAPGLKWSRGPSKSSASYETGKLCIESQYGGFILETAVIAAIIGHSELLITQPSHEHFPLSRMNEWIAIWPISGELEVTFPAKLKGPLTWLVLLQPALYALWCRTLLTTFSWSLTNSSSCATAWSASFSASCLSFSIVPTCLSKVCFSYKTKRVHIYFVIKVKTKFSDFSITSLPIKHRNQRN